MKTSVTHRTLGTLACAALLSAAAPAMAQNVVPPPAPVYGQPAPVYAPPPPAPVYGQPPPNAQPYYAPPPGQPAYGYQPQPYGDPGQAAQMWHSGRRLKSVGQGLAITGIILLPLGTILAIAGLFTTVSDCVSTSTTCGGRTTAGAAMYGIGVAGIILSFPLMGAGIPLWVIGGSRMNRARRMGYMGLNLHPSLQLGPQGVSNANMALSLRF